MADELGTSAGGIHPGKPIIWPTGKSSAQQAQVSQAQSAQTAGGVRTSAPAQTAQASAAAAAEAVAAPAKPGVPGKPAAPHIARALTMTDIKSHLQSIGVPDTDFNTKLASTMLKNGMELSRSNFVQLLQMLSGTNKSMNMQESAILMAMKGMDSPTALEALANVIAQNPQLAAQLTAIQEALANMSSALGVAKGLLNSSLISQLTAILSQLDDSFKNLAEKYEFSGDKSVTAQTLLNDLRATKSLMEGVQEQAQHSDSAEAQVLSSNLMSTVGKLDAAIENLVAQGILSQKGRSEVNYLYQQIPNQGADVQKNVEIVIKRDGHGKKSKINPENTQVVMSVRTANLGKMVCSVIVKGKRVYVIFIFNAKEYGDEARQLISQEISDLQKKMSEKDFVVSGYQVKVDPAMCSVKPYIIPMLPNLEQQLRKIDLET